MSRGTQVPLRAGTCFRLRGCHTLWPAFQTDSTNCLIGNSLLTADPTTPDIAKHSGLGCSAFRSPLLSESLLIYFPPGTEMVHFPGLALPAYVFSGLITSSLAGFPHSEIPGSKPACGSPRLIAACHVLHRLLAPRHPPYALSSLTIKLTPAQGAESLSVLPQVSPSYSP